MEYNLRFYPSGSETATAAVRVETDDKFGLKKFSEEAEKLLKEIGYRAEDARRESDMIANQGLRKVLPELRKNYDNSPLGKVVYGYDGVMNEEKLFFNEEDAVSIILYALYASPRSDDKTNAEHQDNDLNSDGTVYRNPEGFTVTIDHKGDRYTDITKLSLIESSVGFCGAKFAAKKNGGAQALHCLLTKTVFGENITMPSPSTGIVEAEPERKYAGNCLYFETYFPYPRESYSTNSCICNDEDGNMFEEIASDAYLLSDEYGEYDEYDEFDEKEKIAVTAHLFFEETEEGFTFSVLINGKLYKKISKTDEAVIFYCTPLSFAEPIAENFVQGENKNDIVFRKINGQYLTGELFLKSDLSKCKAVGAGIDMPPIPENVKNMKQSDVFDFYRKCVGALYKAFENPEKYFTTKYQWLPEKHVTQWSETTLNGFATDNPPACQVNIKRVDDCKHAFSLGDALITVKASVPLGNLDFEPVFNVPFPNFIVDSVAFTVNEGTVAILPFCGNLLVRITNAETGKIYEGAFGLLKTSPDFDSTGIPSNLLFNRDPVSVNKNIKLYGKIKDAIVKLGIKNCEALLDNTVETRRDAISKALYSKEGMVPDENVVSAAVQLYHEYERTKRIPNIAIVGQAGTGKSTLAKNLGKIFNKDILHLTPSDFRGGFLGHTKFEVVNRLAEAAKNNQIIFLDEAYQLMKDEFGAEAVTLLLPLMSGDQAKIEASLDRAQGDAITIDFGDVETGREGYIKRTNQKTGQSSEEPIEPGIVPIWISGYENEVRIMINQNQGLYRRLKKVVIKNPVTSELLKQFNEGLEKFAEGGDRTARNAAALKKYFDENGVESLKKYFSWGSQPQNSKYFANHAGVKIFIGSCIDSIDFGKELGPQIEDIIIASKHEIKRQLSSVRNEKTENVSDAVDTINVITDIDTRFSDLVGCNSQIAYMQSIIEMLVNKCIYDNYNINVPKGALMEGLPGVGKTFIARAMAGELQERFQEEASDKRFGFVSVSGSELGNKPASYIASIFNTAEEYDAFVLFIDEADAIAKNRNENRYYDRYLELIKQMDGIEKNSNVFILAATNAPENLDPAFVRSGRIDKNLVFDLPDKDSRKVLAKRGIKRRLKTLVNFDPTGKDSDIDLISALVAKRTLGYTAGDIENVINTAFIMYHQFIRYSANVNGQGSFINKEFFRSYPFIKYNKSCGRLEISIKDNNEIEDIAVKELYRFIDEEIERKVMGAPNYVKRESDFNTDANGNCSSIAVHEVGHAIMSLMVGEKFDSITTIPRGDALGYVSNSELEQITKSDFIKRIRVGMGGRIAEEIIYGKDNVSVGALSDMRKATDCARKMIEMWGFSDEFGFMSLSVSTGKYLGNDRCYLCSETFREKSDIAVHEFLQKLYSETFGMLSDKKALIENLAKRVFDEETMTGEDFRKVYEEELNRQTKK